MEEIVPHLQSPSQDQPELRCSHIDKIENYCTQCNIFACDDCSAEKHYEHFQSLTIWKNKITDYLNKCKDCQMKGRILMRNSKSVDELQASIFSKIDQAFAAYYVQMERFKENLKKEMWEKVEQERLKSASEASIIPLKAKLGKIDKLIVDIEKIEVKGAKREILMTIQENIVQDVNQQLDRYHQEKSAAVEYCKTVEQFDISQTINEQDIRKIMELHTPFFQNKEQVLSPHQSNSIPPSHHPPSINQPTNITHVEYHPHYYTSSDEFNEDNYNGPYENFPWDESYW